LGEEEEIKKRFTKRLSEINVKSSSLLQLYAKHIKAEREAIYSSICVQSFSDLSKIKLLEIGAGNGSNLLFFNKLGISWENIVANELMEQRGQLLIENVDPQVTVHIGNAMDLEFDATFDIVFQSTVFTSILDSTFKKNLAAKLMKMVKSDGIILWYDFKYDNPQNRDVKGIGRKEIEALFAGAGEFTYFNTTLLPPLGRRVGNMYNILNRMFPFLKTHVVCVISNRVS